MFDRIERAGDKGRKPLIQELMALWPALPYLGFGIWLAWASLAYSGTLWLSDVEKNGANLSMLYIASTAAFAAVCLLAPFKLPLVKRMLSSKRIIIGAGCLAGVGALFIILAGPYYLLYVVTPLSLVLFWSGAVFTGIGTAVVGLKFGEMYGSLPPRRVLLYASLSQLVIAFIYFAVVMSPTWAPIHGGPSLVGILAFCLLPVLSALLAAVYCRGTGIALDTVEYAENTRALPPAFWRLVALSFLLPVVASMMRGTVVNQHALAMTLEGSNILMLLRIPLAIAFVLVAVRLDARHMNFGKLYSFIAIILVAMIACVPVFGPLNSELSILIYFASSVFEFVMWCLLAFIVFQKKISPIIVFGFGRGIFMLGSALGWWIGVYILPLITNSSLSFAFYMICAAVVLVLSFVLFSERDFERLFSPINEDELSLEELMESDLVADRKEDKKGRFSQCIERLAEENRLSARETEVFKYLAMGRGSDYIADKLQVSWNTARTHTHNVYVKLDVHSREDLIGLVDKEMKNVGVR